MLRNAECGAIIQVIGAGSERVFDLLMGGDVAPRKEFISRSAAGLDRSRLGL